MRWDPLRGGLLTPYDHDGPFERSSVRDANDTAFRLGTGHALLHRLLNLLRAREAHATEHQSIGGVPAKR